MTYHRNGDTACLIAVGVVLIAAIVVIAGVVKLVELIKGMI